MKNSFTQKMSCLALGIALIFPQLKAEDVKTDYTDLLINPGFEVALDAEGNEVEPSKANNPSGDWFRFCPYGWSHAVVYNGVEIPWDAQNNRDDGTITTDPQGVNIGNSYGVNQDAQSKTMEGNYCFWTKPTKALDMFALYQEIPVGEDAGQLPPGEYVISCRLAVMGAENTDRRFTNQRIFAQTATQNKVQYFGREEDYGLNLTDGEDTSYADWISDNTSSAADIWLRPVSVTAMVRAGETLKVGVKTSGIGKDGTLQAGSDAGWFKLDDFRITKKETSPDNYTDRIANPNFELKEDGSPVAGVRNYTERFLPYGWHHTVVKDYDQAGNPIVLPWSADENNGAGTETEGGAAFGQSIGINIGEVKIATIPERTYYSFWAAMNSMPEYTFYQDVTDLPEGKYQLSCYMYVIGTKLRTQRLFANDQVQFFGADTDYNTDNQLTRSEKQKLAAETLGITYAGHVEGGDFNYMSVNVDVTAGETLRLGVKTSGVDKDGNVDAGNAGIIRVDDFRLKRIGDITGIKEKTDDLFFVSGQEGGFLLNMKNDVPAHFRVITISGQTVYNASVTGNQTYVSLPQGLYIVQLAAAGKEKAVKVSVK